MSSILGHIPNSGFVVGLAARVTGPFSEIHFVKRAEAISLNLLNFFLFLSSLCAVPSQPPMSLNSHTGNMPNTRYFFQ